LWKALGFIRFPNAQKLEEPHAELLREVKRNKKSCSNSTTAETNLRKENITFNFQLLRKLRRTILIRL